jgi:transposase-like protein
MVSVKPLDQLTPADLWREVPLEEEFWEQAQDRQRRLLKALLEEALEEEQMELLAAGRYRRVEGRRGYRNGFYDRDLVTQIAIVRGVRVPRARGLSPERAVLGRYRRRCAKVDHLIRDVFLRGVSTREVGEVLQELLGEPVSAATVSRVAAALDREVDRFHQSPLGDG